MKKILLTLLAGLGLASYNEANAQLALTDFNNGLPSTWSMIKVDGNTPASTLNATIVAALTTNAWMTRYIAAGDSCMLTCSAFTNAGTADRWLLTPTFNVNGANVYFMWDDAEGVPGTHDSVQIWVSPTAGTTVASFTTKIYDGPATTNGTTVVFGSKAISLSAYNGQNIKVAFRNHSTNQGTLRIDNVKTATLSATDLALTSVTPTLGAPTAYGLAGSTVQLSGVVTNNGASLVTAYSVTYQIGAATPVVTPITGANIASLQTGTFSGINMTLPATVGTAAVKVWVTLTGDVNHANDTANTQLGTASFMPTKRLLFEEQTGTWCGWCVRGIVFMDSLRTLYHKNVSLIAVHNADPMTVSAYDSWATSFPGFTGFPSVIVDRRELTDPSNILTYYLAESNYFAFADITTSNPVISGTTYTDTVTIKPAMNYSGDYRVILAVTEDRVHNTAGGTWDQHNYYSSASNNLPLTGQGFNYQTATNPIPSAQMYYNHVARAITPSPTGSANLPASMTNNTNYQVVVSATLDPSWVTSNLVGVIMLVRGSDGVVLNTTTLGNPWTFAAVTNVNEGINKLVVYPNPANNVAYVNFELSQETNVGIQITDAIGRIVYTVPASQLSSGSHNITIPTGNFAAGLYNVSIMTEQGNLTQRLSVVR